MTRVIRLTTTRASRPSARATAALALLATLVGAGCDREPAEAPSPVEPRPAALVRAGFQETTVFSGLASPTAVRFSPDGRVFVAEKSGRILVFDRLEDPTPTVFADLRSAVQDYWDRGLLGLELDPGFPSRPYVYALYTYDAAIGGVAPRWGDTCPSPPGPTADGCVVSGRVSRLEAAGDVMIAERVLVEGFGQQYPSHSVGALAFGPDGALYVSAGDGASFNFVDYGQAGSPRNPLGDPPAPVGGVQAPPAARGGSLRSQSLRRPAGEPVLLNGAVLRISPETGGALPGNPLAGHADGNARRIVAYGLRNPFRFALRPGTNELWVGDVGWGDWEEIDRFVVGAGAPNFGWPCYEGSGRQGGYDAAELALCEGLYASPGAAAAPHFAYHHAARVVPGESCQPGSSSISGLAFYRGGSYPAEYRGALFFSDYSRACTWVMFPDAAGTPSPSRIATFLTDAAAVDLQIGPEGDLFYVDLPGGRVRRVRYLAPTALASASASSGPAPLVVRFDGSASRPGIAGDALAHAWDLDGDGAFDDAATATASFTYAATGTYAARLRVTDARGGAAISEPLTIAVGAPNGPPTPVIDTPLAGTTWSVGQVVAFSGRAADPEQGPLPASALTWTLVMQHCPADCHEHAIQSWTGIASGSFVAPDHEYPAHLELRLTARDAAGATATVSRRLDPRTALLSFAAAPTTSPGLSLTVGPTTSTAPFQRTVIVGGTSSISAPVSQTVGGTTYDFVSWSDGGAASHNVVAPATPTTLTATYRPRSGGGTGLTGEYYDDLGFTGAKVVRTDPTIAFGWSAGAPAPGIGGDTFSARWTGKVVARATERVTFHTTSDDGVRLWVNGALVIDNWTDHAATENAGSLALVGGVAYDLRLEYYERYVDAVARLSWSSPSFAKEVVPASALRPGP